MFAANQTLIIATATAAALPVLYTLVADKFATVAAVLAMLN